MQSKCINQYEEYLLCQVQSTLTPAYGTLEHRTRNPNVNIRDVKEVTRQRRMIPAHFRSNFLTRYPPRNVPPPPAGIVAKPAKQNNTVQIISFSGHIQIQSCRMAGHFSYLPIQNFCRIQSHVHCQSTCNISHLIPPILKGPYTCHTHV